MLPIQPDEEKDEIKRPLSSNTVGGEALPNIPPAQDRALALIAQLQRERLKRKNGIVRVMPLVAVIVLASAAFHTGAVFVWMTSAILLSVGATYALLNAPGFLAAANELAKCDDIRAVGGLIEALEVPDPVIEEAVRQSLIRLLPRLRASDEYLLHSDQMDRLLRFIGGIPVIHTEENAELVVAALKGLERVGGSSAIPVVDALANGQRFGQTPRVREAAVRCAAFLQGRARQESESRQLLRASEQDRSADAVTLVRPSHETGATEQTELLRSAAASTFSSPE